MSLRTLATRCLRRPAQAGSLACTSFSPLDPTVSSVHRSFSSSSHASSSSDASELLSPAVMFLVRSSSLDPASIKGTGKGGRLLKFDVLQAIKAGTAKKLAPSASSSASASSASPKVVLRRQEGPRFTATGRRNRSAMFEPLPAPAAAAPAPAKAQPTKVQAIDKAASPAAQQSRAAAQPQPVLRRQEGPRFTAGGRRNRSAMFESALSH